MSANSKQVDGNHYKRIDGEEHWDRIYRLYGRGYFIGCATKYLERYHLKNGRQDLEKAIHFIEKLIELEYTDRQISNSVATRHKESDEKLKPVEQYSLPFEQYKRYDFKELSTDTPVSNGYVNQDGKNG